MTSPLLVLPISPSWDDIRQCAWYCVVCGALREVSGADKQLIAYIGWQGAEWPGERHCDELMTFVTLPVVEAKRKRSDTERFDEMAADTRQQVKQEIAGRLARPKKRRRTKVQMERARADEARRLLAVKQQADPDFLSDQDEDEAAFVAQVKE